MLQHDRKQLSNSCFLNVSVDVLCAFDRVARYFHTTMSKIFPHIVTQKVNPQYNGTDVNFRIKRVGETLSLIVVDYEAPLRFSMVAKSSLHKEHRIYEFTFDAVKGSLTTTVSLSIRHELLYDRDFLTLQRMHSENQGEVNAILEGLKEYLESH